MDSSEYIRQIDLLGSSGGLIKQLSGFRKKLHFVPEAKTQAADGFVQKIATEELAEEGNALFDAIKENFNYKRREIRLELGTGSAELITKDFDLVLRYAQDPEDAAYYVIEYQITNVQNPEALLDAGLQQVLSNHFDQLRFNVKGRMDLEALIDQLEEDEPDNITLKYPADCSHVELHLVGRKWYIDVTANAVSIITPSPGGPGILLKQLDESRQLMGDNASCFATNEPKSNS